ncbi:MAG: DeoR/GlpR family DNA-binding transcription regulator [Solirubrobacteraceae bacterium]
MTTHERRGAIRGFLANRGEVGIAGLAAEFDVSEMTIRRDLEELEDQGVARRVRGGAIATVSRSYEPPLAARTTEAQDAKRRIAEAAADYIEYGETAILDVGSTTFALAQCLRGRGGFTIVTPSVQAATELAGDPNTRVILTGGIVRPGELSLIGDLAESTFAQLNCDVLFLGVGGIDPEKGLTEYNLDDTRVKRAAIKAASRKVALADQTKLGRVCLASIASLSEIDVLITDAAPAHPVLAAVREAGVEIVSVGPTEKP